MIHKLLFIAFLFILIIIAYILTTLFLIAAIWFGWLGYDNLQSVRASTGELDKGIDQIIIEWTSDYANDKELLDKIDSDLQEAQLRLEKLGVEFDE